MDYNITYREKDGAIQAIISYKDSSGRWKQKSKQGFKTQKSAKPWINDVIEELEKTVLYLDPVHEKDKFKDLFASYVEHVELYWEANTINGLDMNIKSNFESIFEKEVRKITSLHIQECVDSMVKKGLKASTIKNYLVKLKAIFKYAIRHKIIKDNPVENITEPEDKNKKAKVKALTKAETDLLLNKVKDSEYYMLSLVAVTCGLRIGELLALKWSDIEEKESTLTVNKQWKIIKKGTNDYGEGPVKRPNSNRTVPIPAKTLEELKKFKKVIDINGRIFPYDKNNTVSINIINLYKRVGFTGVSIHDLRHTYVSRLVAAGLDFQTIAALIGDTVEITIKTYSHFTEDMMTKAKNAIALTF